MIEGLGGCLLGEVSLLRLVERGYDRVDGAELLEQGRAVVDEVDELKGRQATPQASLDEGDELGRGEVAADVQAVRVGGTNLAARPEDAWPERVPARAAQQAL